MNFNNKFDFNWGNSGAEPSDQLKQSGFTGGYKPPAGVFNWFWSKVINAIRETQEAVTTVEESVPTKISDLANDAGFITVDEAPEGTAVVDNLNSTLTAAALSANQGRVLNNTLGTKVDKVSGKGLSTNDYTTAEKNKLAKSVGESTAGETAEPTSGTTVNCPLGAEIFNDYSDRTFDSEGNVTAGNVAAGEYSHVEGKLNTSIGPNSHVEGSQNFGAGGSTHVEGYKNSAPDSESAAVHVEGYQNSAKGRAAHAEGYQNTVEANYSHVEGSSNTVTGVNSHCEGNGNTVSGSSAHGEGHLTAAKELGSHAEGVGTIANAIAQHAQGRYNIEDTNNEFAHIVGNGDSATRSNAHTVDWNGNGWFAGDVTVGSEKKKLLSSANVTAGNNVSISANDKGGIHISAGGKDYSGAGGGTSFEANTSTTASEAYSFAEGQDTEATGEGSHAEGYSTKATGICSHAGGHVSHAEGRYSFAHGLGATAEGDESVAFGWGTIAQNRQFVCGNYNQVHNGVGTASSTATGDHQDASTSLFIIGNGYYNDNTKETVNSNAFRTTADGQSRGLKSFLSSGADFPEYFEWLDGNPNNEDRRGRFVTLDGKKIKLANSEDDYIVGVVSVRGGFIGNAATEQWQGKIKKDVFGEWLTEEVEIPERTDEETGEIIPACTVKRYVINPDYDPEQEYISREFRQEWTPVGLLGQVIVVDDGTCQVNGYCKPSTDGIATAAESGYRVMDRLDETHIEVLIK